MIVVADSGPLHYLSELSAAGAPAVVRAWITKPPTWVDAQDVAPAAHFEILTAAATKALAH